MQNARLDESQAGIKTAGRNISNLRYADNTTLNDRNWRETKEPLADGERQAKKSGLKLNIKKNKNRGIQSHHFMANRRGKSGNVTEITSPCARGTVGPINTKHKSLEERKVYYRFIQEDGWLIS